MKRLFPIVIAVLFCFNAVFAQDTIYTIYKEIYKGKVTEVGPKQVKYIPSDNPSGPAYLLRIGIIDSIKYANGKVDLMEAKFRKNLKENIPQLNTWSLDAFGFVYFTISQSYERRLKNGKVGFRIPLYIGYRGGGIAGEGMFRISKGTYGLLNLYDNSRHSGTSVATGLNVKCYLFKKRIIRAFAGPEVTLGYSTLQSGSAFIENGLYYYNYNRLNLGTFAALGKVGLSINPVDRFNVTIDGGAGAGDAFGGHNPIGWTGVWQVGFALGTNF